MRGGAAGGEVRAPIASGEGAPSAPAPRDHGPSLGVVELALTLFVGAAGLLAGRLYPYWKEQLVLPCPLLELTGLPCPTCGGTRAGRSPNCSSSRNRR